MSRMLTINLRERLSRITINSADWPEVVSLAECHHTDTGRRATFQLIARQNLGKMLIYVVEEQPAKAPTRTGELLRLVERHSIESAVTRLVVRFDLSDAMFQEFLVRITKFLSPARPAMRVQEPAAG